jgi:hypothetical protein
MKKFFFLFTMLVSITTSAQTLSIKIATINYSTKIATCNLSWTARNATHLSDVWVFVDYIEISGNTTTGSWKPATITGATVTQKTTGNATASTVSGNTRGVWIKSVTSGTNFTGQITLQLSGVSAKFNACAYATDYPPNAKITAGIYSKGTYTLKGTKPFLINGSISVNANTYSSGNITTITDATKCPGYRCNLKDEAVGTLGCCAGLTAYNGYCRDLSALSFEVATANIGPMLYANRNQCPSGWRLPTTTELKQMWNYNNIFNLCSGTTDLLWAAGAGTIDQSCNCSANTQYYLTCIKGGDCSNTPNLPAGSTSASGCCGTCKHYIRCVRNK